MRIADLLDHARTLGVDRLDAQLLLAHHLQRPRSWLLAHDDEVLSAPTAERCRDGLVRRAAGEPLAYVLGEWPFRGLRLSVTPAVLIPRPETEVLVDWALQCLADAPQASAVDLGTGSGAIALALASEARGLAVTATDASARALALAQANAQRLGAAITFVQGDWWAPLAGKRFGLAVANPPYIAANDGHLAALVHEPRMALTPGDDAAGLDALHRIIRGAPAHLLPGAWLLLEHGHDQGRAVRDLLQVQGFQHPQTRPDLAGLPRCSGARWLPDKR
jgi:release factor glutamine methyltransferase